MSARESVRPSDDGAWMRRALALALHGWGQTAPNPLVGAVVVRDGVVVGEGWHARYGGPHAEVMALAQAGDAARGAAMYVTLEPCDHHGRTPPCSLAIIESGISRVVAAMRDPNPVAAGGSARLRDAGIDVRVGVEEEAARELNAPFLHAITSERPFVVLKLALSLDGAMADHTRRPGWLTSAESRLAVHRLRAGADAVAVGIGTALADDPSLTVRDVPPPRLPTMRVIFDTSARLPLASRLVRTAREQPVIVVCWAPDPAHAAALEHAGVTLIHAATVRDALVALRAADVRSVLVEGGATLASSLLEDTLVDRLIIFRAPIVLGGDSLNAFGSVRPTTIDGASRWRVVDSRRMGDDEMTVYAPPA